jgi:hypothetical protein
MRKLNSMTIGLAGGLITPLLAFIIYFKIRDPHLHIEDSVQRLSESGVLSYYASLSAIANLGIFFLFLRINADRAARGVLGATILYAFLILFLQLA